MKRFFIIFINVICIALIAAAAVWYSGVLYAKIKVAAPEFPVEAAVKPAGNLLLAERAEITFSAIIPANREIVKVEFASPAGTVTSGKVDFAREKWRWNKNVYRFTAWFSPVRTGEIKESRITVVVSPDEKFTVSVPEMVCENLEAAAAGSELELAGPALPVDKQSRKRFWLVLSAAVILLLAAAVVIWLLLRKKRTDVAETTPWELAIGALENLRHNVNAGDISPVQAFVRLTDIVRNYLECRFALPASRRTTPEFLAELSENSSALPESQKPFVSGFLHAADLIKFAGAAASPSDVVTAVEHAETLVKETIPQETDPKEQKN